MTDLVKLVTRPVLVKDDVVGLLESWLADARRGDLAGVAIAGVTPDGAVRHGWSDCNQTPTLIGAVTRLNHRLNNTIDGTTVDISNGAA